MLVGFHESDPYFSKKGFIIRHLEELEEHIIEESDGLMKGLRLNPRHFPYHLITIFDQTSHLPTVRLHQTVVVNVIHLSVRSLSSILIHQFPCAASHFRRRRRRRWRVVADTAWSWMQPLPSLEVVPRRLDAAAEEP